MITRANAISKAKDANPKVNWCEEWDDAFIFFIKGAIGFGGEFEPVVVLKSNGDCIGMTEYLTISKRTAKLEEFDV